MILIIGVTSRLGKAVAQRLLRDGVPFRAACRNLAKAHWLSELGIDVVQLDLASGAGLTAALKGSTRVVSCVHGLLGRSRQSIELIDVRGHITLIDACIDSSVQRFVYVSALGASHSHPSEFWRAKARTEDHLKASGMEYVILRPGAFMDLYAHDMIGAAVLRGKTVFLLDSGRTPRNMISVADVADAVVKALSGSNLAGQTLEIGAPENLTAREVAAIYAGLSGKTPKVRTIPPLTVRFLATAIAPFHAGIGRLLRLSLQLVGREDLRLNSASGTEQLGIYPVRLETFATNKSGAVETTP